MSNFMVCPGLPLGTGAAPREQNPGEGEICLFGMSSDEEDTNVLYSNVDHQL